ncbi:MAG: hypothetical protein ACFFG0_50540 [Candidatus Thorarchaeota archaeon]
MRREYNYSHITINEIANTFQNFRHLVNPRLILRVGIRYKPHLNNESIPHKSEDYIVRLINQVNNHKQLQERKEKKRYFGQWPNFITDYVKSV